MNPLAVYRAIPSEGITKLYKENVKARLLNLQQPGQPPQHKELFVKVMKLILEFRKAVVNEDDNCQLRALHQLEELVALNSQHLPEFNDIVKLIKNRSSWFRRQVPQTIIEILKQMDPELLFSICNSYYSILLNSGLSQINAVKGVQIRKKMTNSRIKQAKQEALAYFKTTVYNLLQQKTKEEQQVLIEGLNKFNLVCLSVLRSDAEQSLSLVELLDIARPLCNKLGLVTEEELILFVKHCIYLNVYRQPPRGVLVLLEGVAAIVATIIGLGIGAMSAGMYEFARCFKHKKWMPAVLIIYMIAFLPLVKVMPLAIIVLGTPFVLHQAWRFLQETMSQELEGGFNRTTDSYAILLRHWRRYFKDVQLEDSSYLKADIREFMDIGNHDLFIKQVNHWLQSDNLIIEGVLFSNPYLFDAPERYRKLLNLPISRKLIANNSLQYGSLRQSFADQLPYNEQCPISMLEFEDDTKVIGLRHANGHTITLYAANNLNDWLYRHNLGSGDEIRDPLTNQRPHFVRKQDLLASSQPSLV